ncbi:MAG TPA: Xaa-Pro peptidase family protein [Anaerolineales bacterium]|nr:Xaa-Pro peptidase family protein [Anaerolineales bacterium]
MKNEIPFMSRQARLATYLQNASIDALVLNPGASLKYLTGLDFHLSERPVVIIYVPHTPLIIVLPELETAKTIKLPFPIQAFPYREEPDSWITAFKQAVKSAKIERNKRVGFEPRCLRLLEYHFLKESTSAVRFVSAESELAELRMRKDDSELTAMRKAVEIAQTALLATLPLINLKMTERELASELVLQLFRAGTDPQMPFFPIVSSGPNSANPHASPGDRPLTSGDLLVIDWGASCQGYCSDITRTFAIGEPAAEESRIATIVLQANLAARESAQPGVKASSIDFAARDVIERAGYGKYFIHRTGHGLGMESHEPPYIRGDSEVTLGPGMAFTIEPGIYLPERNGVRIEDNVVITSDGSLCLTDLPRDLQIIG